MGARGPAPQPTALKVLRGNPGKRRLNDAEARPAVGRVPYAPRWLSEEAAAEWKRLAPRLHAAGLLTEVDGVALGLLCETFAQYQAARRVVEREGMLAMSEKGTAYQHPALGIANGARREMLTWAREFGMTPSARSRIRVETNEKELTLAEMLGEAVG